MQKEEKEKIKITEVKEVSAEELDLPDLGKRYQVHALIGEGAMGSVYKATDQELEQTVALKLLKPDLARDSVAVKRFEQEVEAAAKLDHANLVSIYGHGQTDEQLPYLSMDYIEGGNLSEYIKKHGKLDESIALELAIQICEALEHAHSNRIIHRDLKPSNILITKSDDGFEQFKVADFGIAKVMTGTAGETGALTGTGDILGSPLYMSPEQCQGEELDERSDIYSFACMLVEVLTGSPPYEGANSVKIILAHLNEPVEKVSKQLKNSGVSKDLTDVILACLNKSKEGRYKNVRQLAQDLKLIRSKAKPTNLKSLKQGSGNGLALILASCLACILIGILTCGLILQNDFQDNQIIYSPDQSTKPALKNIKPSRITDQDLKNASAKDKLESFLELDYSQVTDQGLKYLTYFDRLRWLNLSSTKITDRGLENIANISSIKSLTLNNTKVTDAGMVHLIKLKNLERLYLKGNKISDQAMPILAKLNRLETICLTSTEITDKGLKDLEKTNLKRIHLNSTRVSDRGLATLAKIKTVTSLQLKKSAIDGNGLKYLAQLPNLEYLTLDSTDVKDSDIKALIAIKKLRSLKLASTKIGDNSLIHISQMPSLTTLRLQSTAIGDKNIASLSSLNSLSYLDLTRTGITDIALDTISNLPSLRTLNLSNTKVTDQGILKLANSPKLTRVYLKSCDLVSQAGIKKLIEKKPYLKID